MKRFTYDGEAVYDFDVIFYTFLHPGTGKTVCRQLNAMHDENEALCEVVEAAKVIEECIEAEGDNLVIGSYGAVYKLQQALKKLNPPTKEELLKARLDAADELSRSIDSFAEETVISARNIYAKAKQAHES